MARAHSQRAGDLSRYAMGTANDPDEDEEEENAAGNSKQPERNHVGGSHGWGNESVPTSASSMLGIPGGSARRLTKQATMLPAEGNANMKGTVAQELHRVLMGRNMMLHNTVGVGKVMGGGTGTTVAPTSGKQQGVGRGSTGCSALTEALKMFGPTATTQDF